MHKILARQQLSSNVFRLDIAAPRIAQIRRPGQFVIVHQSADSERIPLTIADASRRAGSISLVIQAVGHSTRQLAGLTAGASIADIAGPLGCPTHLIPRGHALCVGGGVGTAVVHPIAQALHEAGVRVTSVIGARSRERLIFERELLRLGEVIVCTDDGSRGRHGLVTDAVRDQLFCDDVKIVYAIGPVPMMHAVAELTRPFGVRTIVSLNPVMIDGTGMCGGCRISLGGQTRFVCVDGPEFDGHQVDFEELRDRLTTYQTFEQQTRPCADGECRLEKTNHDRSKPCSASPALHQF
jgi:ferredoxin--NADP+ reductase